MHTNTDTHLQPHTVIQRHTDTHNNIPHTEIYTDTTTYHTDKYYHIPYKQTHTTIHRHTQIYTDTHNHMAYTYTQNYIPPT